MPKPTEDNPFALPEPEVPTDLFVVLRKTLGDRYSPDGYVILEGVFYREEEVASHKKDKDCTVYAGKRKSAGEFPKSLRPL